jgi:hypothetical protein
VQADAGDYTIGWKKVKTGGAETAPTGLVNAADASSCSRSIAPQGQGEVEGAALTQDALGPDASPLGLNQALGDGKSQA